MNRLPLAEILKDKNFKATINTKEVTKDVKFYLKQIKVLEKQIKELTKNNNDLTEVIETLHGNIELLKTMVPKDKRRSQGIGILNFDV